jgi:predicted transcriptional regulator
MTLADELTKMKNQIDEAQTELSKQTGVLENLTARLKKEHDMTPDEIHGELERLYKKIDKAESDIWDVLKELKDKYGIETR